MSALNPSAIMAVARRQLGSFLANPLGYIFILAFVVITAAATFVQDEFFRRNIADFGVIYGEMIWILMVLLPALAMGAWSSEREHGTEELLLTMPVSVADAVIGKYLAIAGFFTIAMTCNLSNLAMLSWLGEPDVGQILANYIGWWLLGLGYAALALLGSVMVASNAIAFVFGGLLCALYALVTWQFDLLAPFDRGLFSLDLLVLTVAVTVAGLGTAIFMLSSRRWQADRMGNVAMQIVCLILTVVVAINIGRISQKWHLQTDLSAAGISSLTKESSAILGQLAYPTEVVVVVSDDSVLPENLESKAQELLYKARALNRESGGSVNVTILRPTDPYDEAGTQAREVYGLETRSAFKQTVVGNESVDVFLGAQVMCGSETETVEYFDPGLSVEYEIVRALRKVTTEAGAKPPVTVTIVASENVPESETDRLEALLAWASTERPNVTVKVERVADAAAAADQHGLRVLTITPPMPLEEPAEEEAKPEGEAAAADNPDQAAAEKPEAKPAPEPVDVVLGAVIAGPEFHARVEAIGEADSVDSDMLAAIRKARRKLPVLGVLDTGLELNGGFNMANMGQNPVWGMVSEWGKVYDIRQLDPDSLGADLDDVDALVVALPSSLPPEAIAPLSEWIWSGNPTLLMVDPLPMFAVQQGRGIAPGMPPQPQGGGMMGMQQQPGPPKAGIEGVQPLLKALGLKSDLASVMWSNYTPSFEFTHLPKEFVWVDPTGGQYGDDPMMQGVHTLIFPAPGMLELEENRSTEITPLVMLGAPRADKREAWGITDYQSYISNDPFGRVGLEIPRHYSQYPLEDVRPMLAAHVGGTMAFPDVDGDTEIAPGKPSPAPVNVVVVADTDFIHDGVFNIYRSVPTGQDSAAPAELTRLRNVQWMENVVDVLMGRDSLLTLRAHRPGLRSLTKMDEKRSDHRKRNVKREIEATEAADAERDAARATLKKQLDEIMARQDIDRMQRENMRRYAEIQGQIQVNERIRRVDHQLEVERRKLASEFRESVSRDRQYMRWLMVGIPAAVLLLLVAVVTAVRLAKESTDIPASRDRRKA
ncbi:MAG: Gldg family protein [Planctomycetota bacterium]|jgi:hypothetical protein|nr:Gldg family protein [Planctomycetota bacterium]